MRSRKSAREAALTTQGIWLLLSPFKARYSASCGATIGQSIDAAHNHVLSYAGCTGLAGADAFRLVVRRAISTQKRSAGDPTREDTSRTWVDGLAVTSVPPLRRSPASAKLGRAHDRRPAAPAHIDHDFRLQLFGTLSPRCQAPTPCSYPHQSSPANEPALSGEIGHLVRFHQARCSWQHCWARRFLDHEGSAVSTSAGNDTDRANRGVLAGKETGSTRCTPVSFLGNDVRLACSRRSGALLWDLFQKTRPHRAKLGADRKSSVSFALSNQWRSSRDARGAGR